MKIIICIRFLSSFSTFRLAIVCHTNIRSLSYIQRNANQFVHETQSWWVDGAHNNCVSSFVLEKYRNAICIALSGFPKQTLRQHAIVIVIWCSIFRMLITKPTTMNHKHCMLFTESNKWPRLWFTLLNIGFRQDSGDNNGMVYQLFGAWIETKLLVWWKVVHSSPKPFYEWHLLGVGKLCVQATLRLDRGCWFCSHWFKLRYIVWWMM